jgi:hypothetical protein
LGEVVNIGLAVAIIANVVKATVSVNVQADAVPDRK